MSKPTIAPRPADPIDIDPGVAFKYVVAAKGATSVGAVPTDKFTITQSGKTLTITCTAAIAGAAQILSLSIFASNNEGTVYQKLNFRVAGYKRSVQLWFQAGAQNSATDINFGVFDATVGAGQAIGSVLLVDWKLYFGADSNGGVNLSGNTFFVKSVAARTFKVSATSGGAAVAQDVAKNGLYGFVGLAVCVNASDKLYGIGNATPGFAVNDPIVLSISDGTPLPPELQGVLYIKSFADAAHFKVSATVGGAAIVASADCIPSKAANLQISDGTRKHPSITSAAETDVDLLGAVDYIPTTDIAADQFEYQGLPAGLVLVSAVTGEVTGNVSEAGFFPVLILAYKGNSISYRYWILIVGGTTGEPILPDAVYDIIGKRFYSAVGPAGRADRIDRVLGDVSLLFGFQQNGEDFTMPEGATVRVRAKQKLSDVADLVYATQTLDAPQSQVQLTEDWSDAGIAALLGAETKSVDLYFWFEWRLSGDPAGQYRRSLPALVRVWRNDTAGFTGSTPSFFVQDKPFTVLIGGAAGSLDGVLTAGLAVDTWIARVIVNTGGARVSSEWFLVAGTDVEDPDSGIVRPDDYAAVTNEKIWLRLD